MKVALLIFLFFSVMSCVVQYSDPEISNTWILKSVNIIPFNMYGIDEDLPPLTKMEFKSDSSVVITHPVIHESWVQNYKIEEEDSARIIFIGDRELMIGYTVKTLSKDTLVLSGKYKKSWRELPKPNEFGSNPDLVLDYELILIRE